MTRSKLLAVLYRHGGASRGPIFRQRALQDAANHRTSAVHGSHCTAERLQLNSVMAWREFHFTGPARVHAPYDRKFVSTP